MPRDDAALKIEPHPQLGVPLLAKGCRDYNERAKQIALGNSCRISKPACIVLPSPPHQQSGFA